MSSLRFLATLEIRDTLIKVDHSQAMSSFFLKKVRVLMVTILLISDIGDFRILFHLK